MREMTISGNVSIFDLPANPHEAACVTTNGMIRRDGRAVMGAGIAKLADQRFDLANTLAGQLRAHGNHAAYLKTAANAHGPFNIFSFPTKHDWRDKSDIQLIKQSARELIKLCDEMNITTCYIPRPGCTNGQLSWPDVKQELLPILDDRFIVVSHTRFDA